MYFSLQGTYVTTVTATDGDKMLNAPVEYFIDSGSSNWLKLDKIVLKRSTRKNAKLKEVKEILENSEELYKFCLDHKHFRERL